MVIDLSVWNGLNNEIWTADFANSFLIRMILTFAILFHIKLSGFEPSYSGVDEEEFQHIFTNHNPELTEFRFAHVIKA
jgi:hypothetical protein